MADRLTQAQLARAFGVSRQAIHKLVEAGKLAVGEDGKIDLETARAAVANTVHPASKTAQAVTGGGALAAPAQPAANSAQHVVIPAAATAFLADVDEHGMPTNFHVARTLDQIEAWKLKRIERERKEGDLIMVTAVRSLVASTLAATREALLQLPARLAPVLAAETATGRVHDLLQQELHQALGQLSSLSEQIANKARKDADE